MDGRSDSETNDVTEGKFTSDDTTNYWGFWQFAKVFVCLRGKCEQVICFEVGKSKPMELLIVKFRVRH